MAHPSDAQRLLARFTSAEVYPQGTRPLNQRRSLVFRTGVCMMLGAGIAAGGILALPALAQIAYRVTAQTELQLVARRSAPVDATAQPTLAPLLNAEDAWEEGDWGQAAVQWIGWNRTHADLDAAGWAVRAAIKANDPNLVDLAMTNWNGVRHQLPEDIRAKVPTLALPTPQALVNQALKNGGLVQTARLEEYQALYTTDRGPLLFLLSSGWDQGDLERALGRPDRPFTAELDRTVFQNWMARTPSLSEARVHERGCDRLYGTCDAAPAWTESQRHLHASGVLMRLKDAGCTPAQAWAALQELRLWGNEAHTLVNPEVTLTARQAELQAFRTARQRAFAAVHDPEALTAYFRSWKTLPLPAGVNLKTDSVPLGGLQGLNVDWAARRRGSDLGGWADPPDLKGPLTWDVLEDSLAQDYLAIPAEQAPAHLTREQALAHLQAAVRDSGVAEVRWPATLPDSPQVLWVLGDRLQQTNAHLQAFTGWSGPVYGLSGRLAVHLEATGAGAVGGMQSGLPDAQGGSDRTHMVINTVMGPTTNGSTLHEFWHALDGLAGGGVDLQSQRTADQLAGPWDAFWATQKPATVDAAWTAYWQELRSPALSLDQRRDAALTAWYAMANEGTGINDARALVLGELADLRAGRDSPERTRVRWLGRDLPGFMADRADLKAIWKELAENRVLLDPFQAVSSLPFSESGWQRLCFTLNSTEDLNRKIPKGKTGYWTRATELGARAAEAQAFGDPALSPLRSIAWIYYPHGAERAYQTQVFNRFFQANRTWWAEMQAQSPLLKRSPEPSLAAALAPRAPVGPVAPTVGSAPPLRPRGPAPR